MQGETIRREGAIMGASTLLRHVAIIGASGSGKTVMLKTLLEAAAMRGLASICLDSQGDLAAMRIAASEAGQAIAANTRLHVIDRGATLDPFALPSAAAASMLANTLGVTDRDGTALLRKLVADNAPSSMRQLVSWSEAGIFQSEAAAKLATPARRGAIERAIAGLELPAGTPLDVAAMMESGQNNVVCGWHATPERQQEAAAYVAGGLYSAMMATPNDKLRCLLVVDEAAPLLPPVRNTPAKGALMMLARQARKYGVSMVLATQSVGDIDYRALANVSTLIVGRVVARQDLDKLRRLLDARGKASLVDALPSLEPGQFIMVSGASVRHLQSRRLHTEHRALALSEALELA